MHLSRLLRTNDFTYTIGGRRATFDDVIPDLDRDDRVAIVCRTAGATCRAAGLLLAAVARFYEFRLAESDDFYVYPNYYALHVDRLHGYNGSIDIWPEHKEVVVDADPESIVSAVNDRRITHLLIEDASLARGVMARETVEDARRQLKGAFAFSPWGPTSGADIVVRPSSAAAAAIAENARASSSVIGDDAAAQLATSASEPQAFRRIGTEEVLALFSGYGASDPYLRMSAAYRAAHSLTPADMDRHRFAI